MGRADLIGNGERHLVPPAGAEQEVASQRGGERRPPVAPRSEAPKGRVIEVAPRRNARGADRNERRGEPASFTPPPLSKAKPGILSTIKSKPRAGRK
jgi:hypothetical protein